MIPKDVCYIYKRPYNPKVPVLCIDEKPIQLLDEARERVSAKPLRVDAETGLPKPGRIERVDSQYVRCGTACIFVFAEPLRGWRHVVALESRKRSDFAHYTPKHGSWLNIAEVELSSLALQCLGNQRIESIDNLNQLLNAWEIDRNTRQKGVN